MNSREYQHKIQDLLEYNLYKVIINMGLNPIDSINNFSEIKLYDLLNLIELFYLENTEISRECCFIIASLLWENRESIQSDIRNEKNDPTLTINFTRILTDLFIRLEIPISAKTLAENKSDQSFEGLGSFVLELQRTYDLITKHTINFYSNTELQLNGFQKEIWDGLDDDKYTAYGISAGTSTGKSFLLTHKVISWAYNKIINKNTVFKAVIIVPSIALINQNIIDFTNILMTIQELKNKVELHQHFRAVAQDKSCIFVVTPERLRETLYDLDTQEPFIKDLFNSLDLLICDEIQNLGISTQNELQDDNDNKTVYNERADIYLSLFELISNNTKIIINKTILAGANISKNDLQIKYKKMLKQYHYTYFPKKENRYITPVTNIQLSCITHKHPQEYYIKQEILLSDKSKLTNQCQITETTIFTESFNKNKVHGKTFINKTIDLLKSLNRSYPKTTIISYQRTPNMISSSAETIQKSDFTTKENLDSLVKTLKKYLPEDSTIVRVCPFGVALHHGQLPKEVRIFLELAIKENFIDLLVCNSTITQGVNLPIKFIIIPNRGILSHQNELLNLKGRAGRLMQDLVGYVLFLNTNTFEEYTENKEKKSLLDNKEAVDMDTADDYYQKTIKIYKDRINEKLDELKGIGQYIVPSKKDDKNYQTHNHISRTIIKIRQQLLKDAQINRRLSLYQDLDINILNKNLQKLLQQDSINNLKYLSMKHTFIDPLDIIYLHNNITIKEIDVKGTKKKLDWFNTSNMPPLKYPCYSNILRFYDQHLKFYKDNIMKNHDISYDFGFLKYWITEDNKTYLLKDIMEKSRQYCEDENKEYSENNILKAYTSRIPFDFVKLVSIVEDLYQYRHKVKTNWTNVLKYGTTNAKIQDLIHMGIEREMAIHISNKTPHITDSNSIKKYYKENADEWEKKLLEKFNFIK